MGDNWHCLTNRGTRDGYNLYFMAGCGRAFRWDCYIHFAADLGNAVSYFLPRLGCTALLGA